MFIDERFDCVIISEIKNEIFRTQKFKTRYPWRSDYKDKIKPIYTPINEANDIDFHFEIITKMNEAGIINQSTNRIFDLSWVDRKFIAYAIEYNFHISTNDNDIIDFLDQQFDLGQNKEPLSLINSWISSELIQWDPNHQSIVEDWDICNEPVQSRGDIEEFEYLTEYKYAGP